MTNRLQQALANLERGENVGIIPYVTIGFPTVEETLDIVPALAGAGAVAIELGVPFSDPLADGPTVQASGFRALQQGVTMSTCMEVGRALRDRGVSVPLLFMGYYNPILAYGIQDYARDAAGAGIDGAIIPDLPPDEAEPLRAAFTPWGLDLIPMVAPTSTRERIALACEKAEGFVYCVSVAGTTGARTEMPATLPEFLARVRSHTPLPLAVGFGISERRHVEAIGPHVEAVVVGSRLIQVIDSAPAGARAQRAGEFIAMLAGRPQAAPPPGSVAP